MTINALFRHYRKSVPGARMRLDAKTRERILEVIAITTLADEELLLGVPQTAETLSTLKERAIKRYFCFGDWNTEPRLRYPPFDNQAFVARVKRTAHLIFQEIEDPDHEETAKREYLNGIVQALQKRNLSPAFPPESPVTGGERAGQGGIPAASPSAPRLERQEVPTSPDPRGIHPDSVSHDRDPLATARLGQATLTMG